MKKHILILLIPFGIMIPISGTDVDQQETTQSSPEPTAQDLLTYLSYLNKTSSALRKCTDCRVDNINHCKPCSKFVQFCNEYNDIEEKIDAFVKQRGEDALKELFRKHAHHVDKSNSIERLLEGSNNFKDVIEMAKKIREAKEGWPGAIALCFINARNRNTIHRSLPRIIGNVCSKELNEDSGLYSLCYRLQDQFYNKQKTLFGDQHGDKPNFKYEPSAVDRDTLRICQYRNLSEQTTHEIRLLVQQGYRTNGHCQQGPIFDPTLEKQRRQEEHAQFPAPLRTSCDMFKENKWDCTQLRHMVYDRRHPLAESNPDDKETKKSAAKLIDKMDDRDKASIKKLNEIFPDDFCTNHTALGCSSYEELQDYIEQFYTLLDEQS